MPSNAELAAELLKSSARFFRELGKQNGAIKEQMEKNASTFETVADLVARDPHGEVDIPEGDAPPESHGPEETGDGDGA